MKEALISFLFPNRSCFAFLSTEQSNVLSHFFLTSPVCASSFATKSSHTPCFFVLWHFLETTAKSDY